MVKISAPAKPTKRAIISVMDVAPIGLSETGIASLVMNAPTTDAAWIALTERLPVNGGNLVARLVATISRTEQATTAVAKALGLMRQRGRPLPQTWLDRFADLCVEELDALWSLDDAAHAAAVEPRWVESVARPVPASEPSWSRVVRLYARVIHQTAGLADPEDIWNRLGPIEPDKGLTEADIAAFKENARDVIRETVEAAYGESAATEEEVPE